MNPNPKTWHLASMHYCRQAAHLFLLLLLPAGATLLRLLCSVLAMPDQWEPLRHILRCIHLWRITASMLFIAWAASHGANCLHIH